MGKTPGCHPNQRAAIRIQAAKVANLENELAVKAAYVVAQMRTIAPRSNREIRRPATAI